MCTKSEFKIAELSAIVASTIGVINAEYNSKIKLLLDRKSNDPKKYYRLIFLSFSLFSAMLGSIRVIIHNSLSFSIISPAEVVDQRNYGTFRVLQIVYILLAIFYIYIFILHITFTINWESLKQLFNQLVILQKNIGNWTSFIIIYQAFSQNIKNGFYFAGLKPSFSLSKQYREKYFKYIQFLYIFVAFFAVSILTIIESVYCWKLTQSTFLMFLTALITNVSYLTACGLFLLIQIYGFLYIVITKELIITR